MFVVVRPASGAHPFLGARGEWVVVVLSDYGSEGLGSSPYGCIASAIACLLVRVGSVMLLQKITSEVAIEKT